MTDGWVLWLVLVGLAVGLAAAWVLLVRLPRDEDDIDERERLAEAAWISGIIEQHGGVAPVLLVDEVLDLHQAYLRDPRRAQVEAPEGEPAGAHGGVTAGTDISAPGPTGPPSGR